MKGLVWICAAAVIFLLNCSGDEGSDNAPGSMTKVSTPIESGSQTASETEKIGINELANWQLLGDGEVRLDESEGAVFMTESDSSVGVTLVSPKSYDEDIALSFKVKPLTYESVNVVIISASDKDTGGDIQIPSDHDGGFGLWTQGNVQNYICAFHNGAHERKPFILKNPGRTLIVEHSENVTDEQWFDVEFGHKGSKIWLKIDGVVIVEGNDPDDSGLPGGKIGFRLRGTPDHPASALFKDVVISKI